ncbi:MAG: DUF2723 domain-containing protein [Flavobacteriaceae bacterium]|nr:DUF2723 domain-containing protein [Flavobacteriaceae bacterium]
MKNWTFKKWNNILAWVVFGIALITYLSTIERKFSFWDTGEYISSAVKLEVTHAPGAALFQLMGAVFAIFSFGDESQYGLIINVMSALFSAFTILFLFWTITHITRKTINKEIEELNILEKISIFSAGIIGSLSFTFSDTFWYSAVEGEVYSMASMFIALLVWLITKWENEHNAPDNQRWLILIFFLVGLSVGVHMMVMLAIPIICFLYYAKNYRFTWKNFIIANFITLGVLGFVFKGIFPIVMRFFGKSEIFFVNSVGLPFHSGTLIAFILLIIFCYFIIQYSRKKANHLYQTIALSIVYMIIGFSCWLMIPIRANANPPMNLNNPDTAIGMLDYYNREQYGDWPTSYGQNYTAHLDRNGMERDEEGNIKTTTRGYIYEKNEETGKYDKVDERTNYVYNSEHISIFPRMFNSDKSVMNNYISMYGAPDFEFNYANENMVNNPEAFKIFEQLREKYEEGTITVDDYLQVKNYDLIKVKKPSLGQNLDYFITFQNGYYFVRYLMWNFVGRQNDLEGHQESTNGNWISGIPFIDDALYGDQSTLPEKYKNESTVYFFFLPLILGIIGCYFQLKRDAIRFYALLSLFLLTSVGIIYYTGVKPFEPRERDYAMVGSFYAFAIWIGLGVTGILYFIQKKFKAHSVSLGTSSVLLAIPLMMGFQNYNPHDRSGRLTAYDYAYSALKSLPQNALLFVYGDNDTYPTWAIQETERFRDDVKVINYTLLATPWNIDQTKRRTYNAMPVPSSLHHSEYRDGINEQIYLMDKEHWQNIFEGIPETELKSLRKYLTQETMTLKEAMQFIKSQSEEKKLILKMLFGEDNYEKFNFLPVSKFVLPVNKENAVKYGILKPNEVDLAEDEIIIDYQTSAMYKNELMMMDILANFDWTRSISFSSGGIYDSNNLFYLDDYLQFEGFNYRLVPIKTTKKSDDLGRVDADNLYKVVKNFRWGNFKDLNVHFDETCTSNIISYRATAGRAAEALSMNGQKQKALEVLDLVLQEIPAEKYNDAHSLTPIISAYFVAGEEQKGLKLAQQLKDNIWKEYDYYTNLSPFHQQSVKRAMATQPYLYAMVVQAVVDGYEKSGQKDKAYNYLVNSISVVDKKFNTAIQNIKLLGKEKSLNEMGEIEKITPFYEFLFEVMKPFDSTYRAEKMKQLETQIIQAVE